MINRLDLVRLLINSNYRVYDGSSYKLLMYYYRKIFLDKHRSRIIRGRLVYYTNNAEVSVCREGLFIFAIQISRIVRYRENIIDKRADINITDLVKIIAADEQIRSNKSISLYKSSL